jgi:putative tryptophan/tyrosine transport system substrate-binding protein
MKRRKTTVAAALLTTGIIAGSAGNAQQGGKIPRIGLIWATTPLATWRENPTSQGFLNGLHDLGYEEGRNIIVELRSAEGHWERLPDIADQLVGLKVDVLVSAVCGAPLDAARQATSTIPIVVAACNDDPVETGIIASLARPGGNVTGLTKLSPELAAKRLELLTEMVPGVSRVAVLWDPGYSDVSADWRELRAAARAKSVTLQPMEVHDPADLDRAFATMVHERTEAVITFSDTLTYNFPDKVADLALRNRLPLMSPFREITGAGGLMSHGPNIPDLFRRAAGYVDKILKGAKPADLPVEQPTKFEMAINLKTAKMLGLQVPPTLLVLADEVIE